MKYNWELQTKIYTVDDYLNETCCTVQDMEYLYGKCVKCFIWAMLEDNTNGYIQRLFAPVYAHSCTAHAQATQTVTLELLQDYFEYCKGLETSKD